MQQVESGDLKPCQRLPTEPNLMRSHGVSRSTVRAALAILEDKGIVTRRSGKGTFVAQPQLEQDLSHLTSFPEAMAEQGLAVRLRPVSWGLFLPPENVRQRLGLGAGDRVLRIDKVHSLNDEPVATDSLSMPAWIAERVEIERLLTNSTYAVLEQEAGLTLGAASQQVSATTAGAEVARLLNIRPRDPVLRIERVAYTTSGIPVEHLILHYRADLVVLNVHLPRHSLPMVFEPQSTRG